MADYTLAILLAAWVGFSLGLLAGLAMAPESEGYEWSDGDEYRMRR